MIKMNSREISKILNKYKINVIESHIKYDPQTIVNLIPVDEREKIYEILCEIFLDEEDTQDYLKLRKICLWNINDEDNKYLYDFQYGYYEQSKTFPEIVNFFISNLNFFRPSEVYFSLDKLITLLDELFILDIPFTNNNYHHILEINPRVAGYLTAILSQIKKNLGEKAQYTTFLTYMRIINGCGSKKSLYMLSKFSKKLNAMENIILGNNMLTYYFDILAIFLIIENNDSLLGSKFLNFFDLIIKRNFLNIPILTVTMNIEKISLFPKMYIDVIEFLCVLSFNFRLHLTGEYYIALLNIFSSNETIRENFSLVISYIYSPITLLNNEDIGLKNYKKALDMFLGCGLSIYEDKVKTANRTNLFTRCANILLMLKDFNIMYNDLSSRKLGCVHTCQEENPLIFIFSDSEINFKLRDYAYNQEGLGGDIRDVYSGGLNVHEHKTENRALNIFRDFNTRFNITEEETTKYFNEFWEFRNKLNQEDKAAFFRALGVNENLNEGNRNQQDFGGLLISDIMYGGITVPPKVFIARLLKFADNYTEKDYSESQILAERENIRTAIVNGFINSLEKKDNHIVCNPGKIVRLISGTLQGRYILADGKICFIDKEADRNETVKIQGEFIKIIYSYNETFKYLGKLYKKSATYENYTQEELFKDMFLLIYELRLEDIYLIPETCVFVLSTMAIVDKHLKIKPNISLANTLKGSMNMNYYLKYFYDDDIEEFYINNPFIKEEEEKTKEKNKVFELRKNKLLLKQKLRAEIIENYEKLAGTSKYHISQKPINELKNIIGEKFNINPLNVNVYINIFDKCVCVSHFYPRITGCFYEYLEKGIKERFNGSANSLINNSEFRKSFEENNIKAIFDFSHCSFYRFTNHPTIEDCDRLSYLDSQIGNILTFGSFSLSESGKIDIINILLCYMFCQILIPTNTWFIVVDTKRYCFFVGCNENNLLYHYTYGYLPYHNSGEIIFDEDCLVFYNIHDFINRFDDSDLLNHYGGSIKELYGYKESFQSLNFSV